MLIPIKYHKRKYPFHISANIDEIAGHFDVASIDPSREFCLHTEYSYGRRNFNTDTISEFSELIKAQKGAVPQLWLNNQWSYEFALFILRLCKNNYPKIIEIHPPFSDYTEGIDEFIDRYQIFEEEIKTHFPQTEIILENRSGSIYRGGKFIVSRVDDLMRLSKLIKYRGLCLRIALDIPQLLTSYGGPEKLGAEELKMIFNSLNNINDMIRSIHLWGKRKSPSGRTVAHIGDLTSYFEDNAKKEVFLRWFSDFVNDGLNRYFVPEINSSDEDLHSIVRDLENYGIVFSQQNTSPDRYSAGAL